MTLIMSGSFFSRHRHDGYGIQDKQFKSRVVVVMVAGYVDFVRFKDLKHVHEESRESKRATVLQMRAGEWKLNFGVDITLALALRNLGERVKEKCLAWPPFITLLTDS